MQEAVTGLSSNLAIKNIHQLKWTGSTPYYAYVVSNDTENVIMAVHPVTFETEMIISLEKMNQLLQTKDLKTVKKIPAIQWINHTRFYIETENKYVVFYLNASGQANIEIENELPVAAENIEKSNNKLDFAYREKDQLFVKLAQKQAVQITQDGSKDILYGTSVHRDEFGIHKGIFWSPNDSAIAFYRMDQSMVTYYPIVNWNEMPATVNQIKYPFAGNASHHVTLGVYHIASGKTIYLNTGEPKEQYLTSVTWSPDEKYIYVGILNRDQNHLKMNKYDAKNGQLVQTLFEEKNEKYVEPQYPLFFFNDNPNQFVYLSQKDGFMHMYLYKSDGSFIKQLTTGEWLVNEILVYNHTTQEIFFTGTKDSPLQKNLYAVNITTGKIRRITQTNGTHQPTISKDGNYTIDVYTSMSVPRNIDIINNKTLSEKRLLTAINPLENYNTAHVRNLVLKANNNMDLYAKLILPFDFDSNKKYPVIVYLYNGPHLQLNRDAFPASGNLWYDYMTQRGYIVFVIDGRGSSNRGFAFESAVHKQLGTLEMQDQLTGVEYLKKLSYVDASRMGVHGWSYGGFMTTSLMLREPGVFKCGVAGGPVLDWKMYEIMYTERYMSHPEKNIKGYADNNLLEKIKNLQGKLLLIHGTDDDVVVWQHSLKMLKKAVDNGVQLDYFVYPGHPHNVRGKDRIHLMQKVTDYFDMYLK